jgi:AraC-like DNA-binding protein
MEPFRPDFPLARKPENQAVEYLVAQGATSSALDGLQTMAGRDLEGCVSLSRLFRSPLVEIAHWRCLHDGAELSRERHHTWPVLGLTEVGASVVHGPLGSVLIEPASVILHRPFSPYRTSHPFGCGDEGCNVAISPALAQELRARLWPYADAEISWATCVAPAPMRARLRLFLLLRRLRAGLDVPTLEVEEAVIDLFAGVLDGIGRRERVTSPAREETRESHLDTVERVRRLLHERLAEPLHLAEIAARVGASPFHLARLFRRVTGLPLHHYLMRLRLLSALPRATAAGASLTELALDLGFSSHSHLTAVFRREFGLPPSECRRLAAATPFEGMPRLS